MENVIERLRASKERYETRQSEAGKSSGREWAKAKAEYSELEALTKFDPDEHEDDLDRESLQRLLDPDREWDPREWLGFFETYYGRGDPPTPGFVASSRAPLTFTTRLPTNWARTIFRKWPRFGGAFLSPRASPWQIRTACRWQRQRPRCRRRIEADFQPIKAPRQMGALSLRVRVQQSLCHGDVFVVEQSADYGR
jgi:hypothetical protein